MRLEDRPTVERRHQRLPKNGGSSPRRVVVRTERNTRSGRVHPDWGGVEGDR